MLNYRKLLSYSTLAFTLAIPVVCQASCFESDITGNCVQFAPTFCNTVGNLVIGAQNTVAFCFNALGSELGTYKCDFTIFNEFPGQDGNPAGVSSCNTVLTSIAELCPVAGGQAAGGEHFGFTMELTAGACPENVVND
ncbi:hypothetical protein BDP27DRAFT_582529 [Rhodocollybia butyracea]|uniref:Glycan binding protein Y3-like domain-containing protein n=1 Tax=Rhodocollybia butyracea TaxID=206335 RepID=A0A9P5PWH7_9AGAR|nr:hypothetical protein BDP27DRAFT_582529 [Rhodocollybia butyracea]